MMPTTKANNQPTHLECALMNQKDQKVLNAILDMIEKFTIHHYRDYDEEYKNNYMSQTFKQKILEKLDKEDEASKNIISRLEKFFNQEKLDGNKIETSIKSIDIPNIDLSQVDLEIIIFYLATLVELIKYPFHRLLSLKRFSLSLQLPTIDLSQVSKEVIEQYVRSLGMLGELGELERFGELKHFSLSLQLPTIDLSQVSKEVIEEYVRRLGRLGELRRPGELEMLKHFSLNLQLPDIGLSISKVKSDKDKNEEIDNTKKDYSKELKKDFENLELKDPLNQKVDAEAKIANNYPTKVGLFKEPEMSTEKNKPKQAFNYKDHKKYVDIIEYTQRGMAKYVQKAIDAKNDVNERNANGDYAVLCAAERNDIEIMKMLIKAGADLTVEKRKGITPLSYAEYNKSEEMKRLINDSLKCQPKLK